MWRLTLNPDTPNAVVHTLAGRQTIGRSTDCAIVVDHDTLSRSHAVFTVDGERVWLEDGGSKNGTFVEGKPVVGCAELRSGSLIRFGALITARVDGPPHSVPMHSVSLSVASGSRLDHDAPDTARRLEVLLEVARLLASSTGTADLLVRIAQLSLETLAVDVAIVELPDRRVAQSRAGEAEVPSRSVVEWVRTHRAAGLFAEASSDTRLSGADSVQALEIGSSMAAPLLVADTLFGVLYVDRRHSLQPLDAQDLAFLVAFANQAALALSHAALQAQVTRAAVERHTLLRFFPPSIAEHLLVDGAAIETIETEVTALFCDISAYTELSEGMTPREVIALLNRYFAVVVREVFDRGGTLEKYIGDAVFAVWGAPISTPGDADRAVGAALAIRDAVRTVSTPRGQTLAVHVGLHSGLVAAGNVGTSDYLQYATVGSATNLAARICSTAGEHEVIVSGDTWRALGGRWEGERLDPVPLKGVPGTVERWRVLGRRPDLGG